MEFLTTPEPEADILINILIMMRLALITIKIPSILIGIPFGNIPNRMQAGGVLKRFPPLKKIARPFRNLFAMRSLNIGRMQALEVFAWTLLTNLPINSFIKLERR